MVSPPPLSTCGFLLVNKPVDWTSHDVVGHLRRLTGIKRIGHAGTLDPFATGLLIVGIGRDATKLLDTFKQFPKTYRATFFLGATADTHDRTGVITRVSDLVPSQTTVNDALRKFVGPQTQIPPMHSAKKIGGKKLYELARAGKEVAREPSAITIHRLNCLAYEYPLLTLEIVCSTGTYIRALARDLGDTLGTGAYCHSLERTAIGPHRLEQAVSVPDLSTYPQLPLLPYFSLPDEKN